MADEEQAERGFTIVDKRGDEEGAPAAEPEAPPLPPVDFRSFLISLASSALFHLGLVEDPATGEAGERNLPLARHGIDTLELLQEKTEGNLSEEEAAMLSNLLTELRMHYVQASRG